MSGKETCVASAPESKGLARGGNSLENFACKYTGIVGNWIQDLGRAWSHLFSRNTKKKGGGGEGIELGNISTFQFYYSYKPSFICHDKENHQDEIVLPIKKRVENLDDLSQSCYCRCPGERSSMSLISKGLIVSLRQS